MFHSHLKPLTSAERRCEGSVAKHQRSVSAFILVLEIRIIYLNNGGMYCCA